MIRATKVLALCSFAAALGLAETRSGFLVDAACYEREERNVTLRAPEVDHDRDFEVRQCAPSAKTKSFDVVQRSGQMFKLDSAGNQKAADLAWKPGKRSYFSVTVNGEKRNNTVKVDSIAPGQ